MSSIDTVGQTLLNNFGKIILRYDKGKSDRFSGMAKMSIQFMMKVYK